MGLPHDFKTWLAAQGLVDGTTGWTCFVGYMPPNPDQVVVLGEYSGKPAEQKTGREFPCLQVRVRAAEFDYATCEAKLMAIYDAIAPNVPREAPWPQRINGTDYRAVIPLGSIIPLGYDQQHNRPEMAMNFEIWRSRY